MESTGQQKLIEGLGCGTARLASQGIVLKESVAGLFVGFKYTPGEQGAHVELAHPGLFENGQRQLEAQFGPSQPLGLLDEISLVLQG